MANHLALDALARRQQHPRLLTGQRLHMHGLEQANAHHLGNAACVVPIGLVIPTRLVEHPFGTLKSWMGSTHFLMKRRTNVKTEISLHALAHNLKRVMRILGVQPLMAAIKA